MHVVGTHEVGVSFQHLELFQPVSQRRSSGEFEGLLLPKVLQG